MLSEKQIELLESVAAANENIPPEKFDMGVWFCGTTGCLIGNWLANGPRFNGALRLELVEREDPWKNKYKIPALVTEHNTYMHDMALREFFGLNEEEIDFLFLWVEYDYDISPTRAQAVTRLRNFITTGEDIVAARKMEE